MNEILQGPLPTEETCWQAICARDRGYDGVFYFGVRSTGIYCRPGCPARRPRRAGIAYFASPEAAQAAGYRPCRRCHPDQALNADAGRVEQIRARLDQAEDPADLAELARQVGISRQHLQRIFKAATGLTPHQYRAARRLERLKAELQRGQDVTAALYTAGFNSPSRLYENARQVLGMTPGAYRQKGKGMEIRYTIFETPLGRMLLAATADGICKASFGEDDAGLVGLLRAEFAQAAIQRDDLALAAASQAVTAYFEERRPLGDLPLAAQGTPFQDQVWAALRQIPYGQTRTYAQLAQTVGRPTAVRAAAHACAANPLAVITPCHRVLRSDGALGGYHWGIERKQKLLEMESARPNPPAKPD